MREAPTKAAMARLRAEVEEAEEDDESIFGVVDSSVCSGFQWRVMKIWGSK